MRTFFCIFIVLLLSGCHDDYWDLGDSYVYNNCYIYHIGDVHHNKRGSYDEYEELVPFEVVDFAYDENYIIAYQKPDSAVYRQISFDSYKNTTDSTKLSQAKIDSLESMLDSMLRIQECYWIICKKDKKVYGPMNEFDFKQRCKQMNVKLGWIRNINKYCVSGDI